MHLVDPPEPNRVAIIIEVPVACIQACQFRMCDSMASSGSTNPSPRKYSRTCSGTQYSRPSILLMSAFLSMWKMKAGKAPPDAGKYPTPSQTPHPACLKGTKPPLCV